MFGLNFGGGAMDYIMPPVIIAFLVLLAVILGLIVATAVMNAITRPRDVDFDALRGQLREHLAHLREQEKDGAGIGVSAR